jgi:hypothetical protein
MKMYLNLATRDLDASVAFSRTLLLAEPAKHYADYALFVTDEPASNSRLTKTRKRTLAKAPITASWSRNPKTSTRRSRVCGLPAIRSMSKR